MIAALVVMSLLWWSSWRWFRHSQSVQVPTVVATPANPNTGENVNPDLWRSDQGAWTALDELQLTRLLKESSSVTGAAPNPAEPRIPHVDLEDTP